MQVPLLSIRSVSKDFGGLRALSNVTFDVDKGSITALIGPNGAGKSTLLNVINGLYTLNSGMILFEGQRISSLPPYEIGKKLIARTFQTPKILPQLSVLDNIMSGAYPIANSRGWAIILWSRGARAELARVNNKVHSVIQFLGLEGWGDVPAGSLPLAHQRLTEMARALVCQPKLLLLDEPLGGLTSQEKAQLKEKIIQVHSQGITILFIDHEVKTVFELADKIVVLNFGQKIAEGTPDEVHNNSEVREAYLGSEGYSAAR